MGEGRRQRRPECLGARHGLDFAAKLLWHAAGQWILHLHTNGHNVSSWLGALACATAGLLNGRRTVLSLGSGLAPDWIRDAGPIMRGVVRLTLALTGVIVCRNARSRAAIAALGVPAGKIVVLSCFYGLGPTETTTVPPPAEEFLNAHSPVIGAGASIGPEYGLPPVAEAPARLRTAYPRLGPLRMRPARVAPSHLDGSLLRPRPLPPDTALAVMRR